MPHALPMATTNLKGAGLDNSFKLLTDELALFWRWLPFVTISVLDLWPLPVILRRLL
jgi:hypothetical protein